GEIRFVLAKVAYDAAAARDGAGAAQANRIFLGEHADAARALEEDAVAIQEARKIDVGFRKIGDELAHLGNEIVVDVEEQPADARVARVEALAAGGLEDVVEQFALVEGVEERGEGAEVDGRRADAEQMIAEPAELVHERPQILAARRQLDAQQFLDRTVPGDF